MRSMINKLNRDCRLNDTDRGVYFYMERRSSIFSEPTKSIDDIMRWSPKEDRNEIQFSLNKLHSYGYIGKTISKKYMILKNDKIHTKNIGRYIKR